MGDPFRDAPPELSEYNARQWDFPGREEIRPNNGNMVSRAWWRMARARWLQANGHAEMARAEETSGEVRLAEFARRASGREYMMPWEVL